EPVKQLRKAPFGGVRSTTPVDVFQTRGVRGISQFGGFAPRAVVAPEVVIVERLKSCAYRDDAGTGRIERNGFDIGSPDTRGRDRLLRRFNQGLHLIGVALGRV